MALERLVKAAAKPLAEAGESIFGRALKAIKIPAIPEAAARGTVEKPAVLDAAMAKGIPTAERAEGVPYAGTDEFKSIARETAPEEVPSLEENIQQMKDLMGSFFRRDPNLPKDIQQTLYTGAWRGDTAKGLADRQLRKVYETVQTDPVRQAAQMNDFLIMQDEVAQSLRNGKQTVRDKPITTAMEELSLLEKAVSGDVEVGEAITRRRALWDTVFDDMVKRGWIIPDRYLEDYTPIRKIHGVLDGLASQGGEKFQSKLLNSTMSRTGENVGRETNLIALEADLLEDYMRKVSEHEMFLDLVADKTVNFTEKFVPGDRLPSGLAAYHPGSGMVGKMRKSPEGEVLDGMVQEMRTLPGFSDVVTPGSYVFPKPLAKAMMNFQKKSFGSDVENSLMRAGRGLARWLTVYNPANTRLNMASDLMLAMHGLPGEAAHPIGIMRHYGKSAKAAYEIAFTNKNPTIKIGNQVVDVRAMVEKEGLSEATLFNEVKNQKISDELARLMPEAERKSDFVLFDVLHRDRLATELAPRIAAGIEAYERTGNIKEFGRVGREITLTYGAGAPRATRMPLIRIMSPFLQFIGLASGRVFDLLRAPESRNRTIGSVMAVPVVTWMWNTRNPAFQEAENSLTPFERDQAHVTLPDFEDPTKPMRDVSGKFVIVRFNYSVPEQVMKMAGLGNAAARLARVKEGRDTPGMFLKDTVTGAGRNTLETLTMLPGLLSDVTAPEGYNGKPITLPERVMRLLPIAKIPLKGMQAASNYGPAEGAKTALFEAAGIKQASVMRRGKSHGDADLVIARKRVADAKKALRRSMMNEGKADQAQARKRLDEAVENLKRIVPAVREDANARREQ